MSWLNYHHLLYFRAVVHEGGLVPAAKKLRLTHTTVLAQVRALEESLGEKLLERRGRRLYPTEAGRVALRYADEVFAAGRELVDALQGRPARGPQRLSVGIAQVVPKLVAHRLLEPALRHDEVRLVAREGDVDRLVAELASHSLDLVLSDGPLPQRSGQRAYNHLLGECGMSFFAPMSLSSRLRAPFPHCLDGAPMLLPTEGTSQRRALEEWFERQGVRPVVAGEFDDTALMKVFGEEGAGVFPSPSVVEDDVVTRYRVRMLGRAEDVRERFYAISVERRIRHPGVALITEQARALAFRPRPTASRR